MEIIDLKNDDWLGEYQPFKYPVPIKLVPAGSLNNSLSDNVKNALITGEDNVINSAGVINGNENIIGTDSNQYIISGNNNLVGHNCNNVMITGNNNIVDNGVSNVTINGNGIMAKQSGMVYYTLPQLDYYNYIDAGKDNVLPIGSRNQINIVDAGKDTVLNIGSRTISNIIISE